MSFKDLFLGKWAALQAKKKHNSQRGFFCLTALPKDM